MARQEPDGDRPAKEFRRGGVKFVLLHHGTCAGDRFHYRIHADGKASAELDEAERGQHPRSIGVLVDGNFDVEPPADAQIDALKRLLLTLKLRYPDVQLGAHRQVRGGPPTTCPGRKFPMKALAAWSRDELLRQRQDVLTRDFESQYSKI